MTSILEIKCPTCKDSDCVESVRHDNCTACGWAQFTPLDQPASTLKYDCKVCDGCGRGMSAKEANEHAISGCKPADSGKCECDNDGEEYCPKCKTHKWPHSDQAVEEIERKINMLDKWRKDELHSSYHYELIEILKSLARGSK